MSAVQTPFASRLNASVRRWERTEIARAERKAIAAIRKQCDEMEVMLAPWDKEANRLRVLTATLKAHRKELSKPLDQVTIPQLASRGREVDAIDFDQIQVEQTACERAYLLQPLVSTAAIDAFQRLTLSRDEQSRADIARKESQILDHRLTAHDINTHLCSLGAKRDVARNACAAAQKKLVVLRGEYGGLSQASNEQRSNELQIEIRSCNVDIAALESELARIQSDIIQQQKVKASLVSACRELAQEITQIRAILNNAAITAATSSRVVPVAASSAAAAAASSASRAAPTAAAAAASSPPSAAASSAAVPSQVRTDEPITSSRILDEDLFHELQEWKYLGNERLLYRASRDGWTNRDFFRCCALRGTTLTIIKAAGTGYVFGAYIGAEWPKPPRNMKTSTRVDKTGCSFIFSLTNAHSQPFRLLQRVSETHVLSVSGTHAPMFGHGIVALMAGRTAADPEGNWSADLASARDEFRLEKFDRAEEPIRFCQGFKLDATTLAGSQRFAAAEIECYSCT